MGHPFGASGPRVLTTLLHEMPRRKARRALATLCIGAVVWVSACALRVRVWAVSIDVGMATACYLLVRHAYPCNRCVANAGTIVILNTNDS